MNDKEIRLECLKLAISTSREFQNQMDTAKKFEEYVTGVKVEVPPEYKKSGGKKNVDNSAIFK